jgi:alginate O-acetyltransferase complex protein AlgI
MVFTSQIFLFYFLPLALLIYYLLPQRWRNRWLTLASYLFYGWWKPWFVCLMLASSILDYAMGRIITCQGATPALRKVAFCTSIIGNLSLLGFFKYAMFAQENINALLHLFGAAGFQVLQVTLPIGISFYTFQTMSYSLGLYLEGEQPVRRISDLMCFVSLFPQLLAGPIVRYRDIVDQLAHREHTVDRFSPGVTLFMLGFAKKTLLANPMGTVADVVFAANAPSMSVAWFGITAYAFQIYFDFSGYSDMAVGLGRMFGFELPKNFDSPYHSQSITEFWRRWHISLSSYLRDYLFYPLELTARRQAQQKGVRYNERRTGYNLTLVMLLCGLWHGAKWQFVIWGTCHGALLAAELRLGKKTLYEGLPRPLRIGLTFVLVLFSWVLFRAVTLGQALQYFGALFGLAPTPAATRLVSGMVFSPSALVLMGLCFLVTSRKTQAWDFAQRVSWPRAGFCLGLFLISLAAMFTQAFKPFLYFQF